MLKLIAVFAIPLVLVSVVVIAMKMSSGGDRPTGGNGASDLPTDVRADATGTVAADAKGVHKNAESPRMLGDQGTRGETSESATARQSVQPEESLQDQLIRILAQERASKLAGAGHEAPAANSPEGTDSQDGELSAIHVAVAQSSDDLIRLRSVQLIGRLVIAGSRISNQSLEYLEGMRVLSLSVEAENVTSAGLMHVAKVKYLHSLRLWSPGINGNAFEVIATMTGLQQLDLEGTSAAGERLAELGKLPKLASLTLGPLSADDDVALLVDFASLRELDLRSCSQLTDRCVKSLSQLKQLQELWLPSQLSQADADAVAQSLPNCHVRRG